MAKMLARSGFMGRWRDEILVGAHGQDRKLKHRIQRRREDGELRREVDAYPDDLTEGRERRIAQYGWETGDPLYDWSDCRHGCNGDCVTGGSSERCTFVCHGGVADVDHDRALAYIAEFADQEDEMVCGSSANADPLQIFKSKCK